MSKQTKTSLIAAAGILLVIAAVLITNFFVYPVYQSYLNEDAELRVEIDGAVYQYLPDTEWAIDSEPTNIIGYLDNISTTLKEYEGDDSKSVLNVSASGDEKLTLIKDGIELKSASEENVYRIAFDDPEVNRYLQIIVDASFETTDADVIKDFFAALRDSGNEMDEEAISQESLSNNKLIPAFILNCYNKNLPIAAAGFQVFIWEEQFICYDTAKEAFAVIPAEVFSQIAGGEFDAEALLVDE